MSSASCSAHSSDNKPLNSVFTPYQSAYFAHWLTQSGRIENQVSRTMASARVDMNPHQVEAACFALKSPLAKGVLLADEVGLGKTIEASLVMAQKWAEGKRAILLVAPASLRKQWLSKEYVTTHPHLNKAVTFVTSDHVFVRHKGMM